jgi:hypothetical protein
MQAKLLQRLPTKEEVLGQINMCIVVGSALIVSCRVSTHCQALCTTTASAYYYHGSTSFTATADGSGGTTTEATNSFATTAATLLRPLVLLY